MATDDTQLSRHTALTLVITAVVQSALLLFLHKALDHEFWPATDSRWLYAAYTVFVGVPLFLYLGLREWNDRVNIPGAAIMAVVLFWLGWHAGWVAMPYAGDQPGEQSRIIGQLVPVGLVFVFIAAFIYRGWRDAGDWRQAPARFLPQSWDNALTLGFLHLFLLVFCLLLVLWAALFALIDIDFFGELFTTPEFIYPVTGLVGGLGLVIIRQRVRLISSVRYMCEALIRALLPLAAVIVLCFLIALPFTGLDTLWDTGFGTLLLILISAIILFAFNADFGGRQSLAYPTVLDWLVRAGVVVLPVSLALAGWGLWLRVDQYGWTLSRYWALFVILVLAAFALAYVGNIILAAIRRQKPAYGTIEHWNAGIGIALMVALLMVNTGILDFRKLAAADQINRLESGEVEGRNFDATYLRFHLGNYGYRTLVQLRDEVEADNPDLARRIQQVLDQESRWSAPDTTHVPDDDQTLQEQFRIEGNPDEVPIDLLRAFLEDDITRRHCLDGSPRCRIIPLDIYGESGWALTTSVGGQWMRHSRLVRPDNDGTEWIEVGVLGQGQCPDRWEPENEEEERETTVELLTEPAPFLRINFCAYPLQLHLDPKPMP